MDECVAYSHTECAGALQPTQFSLRSEPRSPGRLQGTGQLAARRSTLKGANIVALSTPRQPLGCHPYAGVEANRFRRERLLREPKFARVDRLPEDTGFAWSSKCSTLCMPSVHELTRHGVRHLDRGWHPQGERPRSHRAGGVDLGEGAVSIQMGRRRSPLTKYIWPQRSLPVTIQLFFVFPGTISGYRPSKTYGGESHP